MSAVELERASHVFRDVDDLDLFEPGMGDMSFPPLDVLPASLLRFSMLQCYDGIREHRLPAELRDKNPSGDLWRNIDGAWSQADVATPDAA